MNNSKRVEWSRLDNASKYFPATCSERDPKVFRISCELFEDVEPEILQQALDLTIERFPLYKSVLRRGVFWYYFETSDAVRWLKGRINRSVLQFIESMRKNYYLGCFTIKRINIEIFHALSDGTGALWFMVTLVYHYLLIRHKDDFSGKNLI